jgi:RNA polymerase sigma factor (sigma-70 family)
MAEGKDSHTRKLSREIDTAYQAYLHDEPDALYRAFRSQARNRIWWHLLGHDPALEHDIATRAMRALPRFRAKSRVSTWFFRIAENEIKRALRELIEERGSRVPLKLSRDGDEDDSDDSPELLDEARKRGSRHLQARQAKLILAKLGEDLPHEQAAVLYYLAEGYTFKEIGQKTGVSLSTAASRFRLARAKMRAGATKK